MSVPLCKICGGKMTKYGKTSSGKQRWICRECMSTSVFSIDTKAKDLEAFIRWLLSRDRQSDITPGGRTFRRRIRHCWDIWALPPLIDEIHEVIYVDGLHLGKKAVVLIACSDEYVLGWYLARKEHANAWSNLLRRIAPPKMVVIDGGPGAIRAIKQIWPYTSIQRCTFHVFTQVKRYTTSRPNLDAGRELLEIARNLLSVKTKEEQLIWIASYEKWLHTWDTFLEEKTYKDGRWEYTHERLRKARRSLNRLNAEQTLFRYLDDELSADINLPATNNKIEGGVNAPLREMLRLHRGMSLTRRIKAVYWWCYMHTECPLGAAGILDVMPTDNDIAAIYNRLDRNQKLYVEIPQWGDAIMWSELHHMDYSHQAFRHDWD